MNISNLPVTRLMQNNSAASRVINVNFPSVGSSHYFARRRSTDRRQVRDRSVQIDDF
jgi:hypothetical protein